MAIVHSLSIWALASEDDKIEVEHMLEQCELKISKLLSLTAPLEEVSDRQRRMDDAASVRFVSQVSCKSGPTEFLALFEDEKYEEKLMLRSQSEARIKLNVQEKRIKMKGFGVSLVRICAAHV